MRSNSQRRSSVKGILFFLDQLKNYLTRIFRKNNLCQFPAKKIVLPYYGDCIFLIEDNPVFVIFRRILPMFEFA